MFTADIQLMADIQLTKYGAEFGTLHFSGGFVAYKYSAADQAIGGGWGVYYYYYYYYYHYQYHYHYYYYDHHHHNTTTTTTTTNL